MCSVVAIPSINIALPAFDGNFLDVFVDAQTTIQSFSIGGLTTQTSSNVTNDNGQGNTTWTIVGGEALERNFFAVVSETYKAGSRSLGEEGRGGNGILSIHCLPCSPFACSDERHHRR